MNFMGAQKRVVIKYNDKYKTYDEYKNIQDITTNTKFKNWIWELYGIFNIFIPLYVESRWETV